MRFLFFFVTMVLLGIPEFYLARSGLVSPWGIAFMDTFYLIAGSAWVAFAPKKPKIWPNGLCPTCGKKIGEDFTSIKKVFEGTA